VEEISSGGRVDGKRGISSVRFVVYDERVSCGLYTVCCRHITSSNCVVLVPLESRRIISTMSWQCRLEGLWLRIEQVTRLPLKLSSLCLNLWK
jgi:hypothetical protein